MVVAGRRCPGAWSDEHFLVSFAVVDTMPSLSVLRWNLLGPNDFHLVDHTVWLVSWSTLPRTDERQGLAGD